MPRKMGETNLGALVDWLLTFDPLVILVVFLVLRGEIKSSQLLQALNVLKGLAPPADDSSKAPLTK